jgi:hypothetical protein
MISARWNGGAECRKKRKNFVLGHFYTILNLEVERKLSHSLSPMAFRLDWGGGWGEGLSRRAPRGGGARGRSEQTGAYTYVNFQVNPCWRKFPLFVV